MKLVNTPKQNRVSFSAFSAGTDRYVGHYVVGTGYAAATETGTSGRNVYVPRISDRNAIKLGTYIGGRNSAYITISSACRSGIQS